MKRCARCGEEKDEEEFNYRWKALGRRQSVWRDCQRLPDKDHHERHTEEVRAKASVTKKKAREEAETVYLPMPLPQDLCRRWEI